MRTVDGRCKRCKQAARSVRANWRGSVQLIDARHDPTTLDADSVYRLGRSRRPLCLVFTKADKVSRNKLDASISRAVHALTVRNDVGVVPFSSVTGQGKRELWAWIESALAL